MKKVSLGVPTVYITFRLLKLKTFKNIQSYYSFSKYTFNYYLQLSGKKNFKSSSMKSAKCPYFPVY